MALGIQFFIGRLLNRNERVTTAKLNAMVKGMAATLSGTVGNAELEAGAVSAEKTRAGAYWYAAATLSGNTYTASYEPVVGAYVDGLVLVFKADLTNAGAVNLDAGAGAKPLVKLGGNALSANDLPAGGMVEVRYNTTLQAGGCWEVTSLLSAASVALAADCIDPAKVKYNVAQPGTSGAVTLDWSTGFVFRAALTGNITFGFSNPKEGQSILVKVSQPSAGGTYNYTVGWGATINWRGGAAPTQTTGQHKTDLYTITYVGGKYFGTYVQNFDLN